MTMGPEPMTRIFRIEVSLGMVVKWFGKDRRAAKFRGVWQGSPHL